MRAFAMQAITAAALAAGLPEGRVTDVSAKDNLTIPRPRLEVGFSPQSYARTGRKLAVTRAGDRQTVKTELYEIRFEVAARIYADDPVWLEAFEYDFIAALPGGANDSRGNWVKIRASRAVFDNEEPTKRVGSGEIKVFSKVNTLFTLSFTGRVTREEEESLVGEIIIEAPKMAQGSKT
jgi:hypothetical protein